ncbi:MAG: hypothetical protein QOJ39_2108 [Candidatus Eremiobacteraeota bacterium]|jgi:hypothetical protein|nr:hypothetical protein [Candidatus Eremiobacteraeota bacterium]
MLAKKIWYVAGAAAVAAIVVAVTLRCQAWYAALCCIGATILDRVHAHPMHAAFVLIVLIVIAYVLLNDSANPLRLALGDDGRLSTSKFQFLMWTVPVVFVFATLMFARNGQIANVPPNVLVALGFSLSTVVGAKGITVSYKAANRIVKSDGARDARGNLLPAPVLHPGDLFENDRGQPDLTKAQMLAWTVVAIADFLYNFFVHFTCYVDTAPPTDATCVSAMRNNFPDIDTALMVLMGLGQGTYLAGKLVSTDVPQIVKITVTLQAAPPAVIVTVLGQNFAGGTVTVNGVTPTELTWDPAGTSVRAVAPNPLAGTTIKAGDVLDVDGTINNVAFARKVQV